MSLFPDLCVCVHCVVLPIHGLSCTKPHTAHTNDSAQRAAALLSDVKRIMDKVDSTSVTPIS